MPQTLVLPQLSHFKVSGFGPIFSHDIDFELKSGPNIILGGNGLGKTTIVQALVYGLTGGLAGDNENDKRRRWDHIFFRSRLESSANASVEVGFRLQEERITIRRGFSRTSPTGVRSSSTGNRWVEGDDAEVALNHLLAQHGRYRNSSDFAFVVNRLLYLPEDRRLLAWDTDAQTRILMLINGDVSAEEDFRSRRAELKRIDSRKRHVHVQIGHAERGLARLIEVEIDDEDELEVQAEDNGGDRLPEEELPALVVRLQEAIRMRAAAEEQLSSIRRSVSETAQAIEMIQNQLEESEAAAIWKTLDLAEKEHSLAMHKLMSNGVCPSCGTTQRELQAKAKEYFRQHRCCLCGSGRGQIANPAIDRLRHSLEELLARQQANENVFFVQQERVKAARTSELEMQAKVNAIRFSMAIIPVKDELLVTETKEGLAKRKAALENEEAALQVQMNELQSDLDREYTEFLRSVHTRIAALGVAYQRHATEFLGVSCTLIQIADGDRLMGLTAFVPEFDGIRTAKPS